MEEIPSELWLKGGVGALVMAICFKWLMPLLQKTAEAATSRQNMDATLHNLHSELLEKMSRLTDDLSAAHIKIAALTSKLEAAEATVRRLTDRLAELEGKG